MLIRLDSTLPLGEQIYDGLCRLIQDGEFAPGRQLPASRRLAKDLGVARNTVVAVYQQLQAEGYLETHGTAGTRVSRQLPIGGMGAALRKSGRRAGPGYRARISREAQRITEGGEVYAPITRESRELPYNFDFNANVSDARSRRAWTRIIRRLAAHFESRPHPYDFRREPGPLHRALVRHLRLTRGVRCEPHQIIVTTGGHQALHLSIRLLLNPGDAVAMEDPHYVGIRNVLRARGVKIVPVPVDDHGIRTDRLPRRKDVRAVYTTPSHQLPTGVVTPVTRRLQMIAWAGRQDAWILENDHNCEYRYDGRPIPSIQGLDESGRTLYVGGFGRLFSPPSAMGYVVVPEHLANTFQSAVMLEGVQLSRLDVTATAEFLESGEMEKLLRRVWRRTREQRRHLYEALMRIDAPDLFIRNAANGLHLHVELRGWTVEEVHSLVRVSERLGVGVSPDAPYHFEPGREPGLLLGFANIPPDDVEEGVSRFATAIDRTRPRRLGVH